MPSCGDYIMHFLTLPWKLIFAFIPPTGKNGIQYNYTVIQSIYSLIMICLFLQRWHFKIAYAQHINILDLCYINSINMRGIDITLGGSRKVKCIPAPRHLAPPSPVHPHLHAPLQPSHQRQWWLAVSNQL